MARRACRRVRVAAARGFAVRTTRVILELVAMAVRAPRERADVGSRAVRGKSRWLAMRGVTRRARDRARMCAAFMVEQRRRMTRAALVSRDGACDVVRTMTGHACRCVRRACLQRYVMRSGVRLARSIGVTVAAKRRNVRAGRTRSGRCCCLDRVAAMTGDARQRCAAVRASGVPFSGLLMARAARLDRLSVLSMARAARQVRVHARRELRGTCRVAAMTLGTRGLDRRSQRQHADDQKTHWSGMSGVQRARPRA